MSNLKELIVDAWSNAVANGDEERLRAITLEELACDMVDCDAFIADQADWNDQEQPEKLIREIMVLLPEVMNEHTPSH